MVLGGLFAGIQTPAFWILQVVLHYGFSFDALIKKRPLPRQGSRTVIRLDWFYAQDIMPSLASLSCRRDFVNGALRPSPTLPQPPTISLKKAMRLL